MDNLTQNGHSRGYFLAITLLGIATTVAAAFFAEQVISGDLNKIFGRHLDFQWWIPSAFTLAVFLALNFVISAASVRRFLINFLILIGFKSVLMAATALLFIHKWGVEDGLQRAFYSSFVTALLHVVGSFLMTLFLNANYFPEEEMEEEIAMRFAHPEFRIPEMEETGGLEEQVKAPLSLAAVGEMEPPEGVTETESPIGAEAETPGFEPSEAPSEIAAETGTSEAAIGDLTGEETLTGETVESQAAEEKAETPDFDEIFREAPPFGEEPAEFSSESGELPEEKWPPQVESSGIDNTAYEEAEQPEGEQPDTHFEMSEEPVEQEVFEEPAGEKAEADVEAEGVMPEIDEIARYRDSVLISIDPIYIQIPEGFAAMSLEEARKAAGAGGKVPFPKGDLLDKIAEGEVLWDAEDAFSRLPHGVISGDAAEVAQKVSSGKIELPLVEIIQQIPESELRAGYQTTAPETQSEEAFPDLFQEEVKPQEEAVFSEEPKIEEAPEQEIELASADTPLETEAAEPAAQEEIPVEKAEAPAAEQPAEGREVVIGFEAILSQLPEDSLGMNADDIRLATGKQGLAFPQEIIAGQLGEGIVRVDAAEALSQLPQGAVRDVPEAVAGLPDGKIELPLSEIISQLPMDALVPREAGVTGTDEDLPDLFQELEPTEVSGEEAGAAGETVEFVESTGQETLPEMEETAEVAGEAFAAEEFAGEPEMATDAEVPEAEEDLVEVEAAVGEEAAAMESPTTGDAETIHVSLDSILSQIPAEMMAMNAAEIEQSGLSKISLPVNGVIPQLAEGSVSWDAREILAMLPGNALARPVDEVAASIDGGRFAMPLDEIVKQVMPEMAEAEAGATEAGEEFPDIFQEAPAAEESTAPVEAVEETPSEVAGMASAAPQEMEVSAEGPGEPEAQEEEAATTPEKRQISTVNISVGSIISQIPPELLLMDEAEVKSAGVRDIPLPADRIAEQLSEGQVEWDAEEILSMLPYGTLTRPAAMAAKSIGNGKFTLPLDEIVRQMPDLLMAGSAAPSTEEDELPDFFHEASEAGSGAEMSLEMSAETPLETPEVEAAGTPDEAEPAAVEPSTEKLPVGASAASDDAPVEGTVSISVGSIIPQVPALMLNMDEYEIRSAGLTRILIPVQQITGQLAEGRIEWDAEEILSSFPQGALSKPASEIAKSIEGGKFTLPLDEIVRQIPEMMGAEVVSESIEGEEIPDLFQEAGTEAPVEVEEAAAKADTLAPFDEETMLDEDLFVEKAAEEQTPSVEPAEVAAASTSFVSSNEETEPEAEDFQQVEEGEAVSPAAEEVVAETGEAPHELFVTGGEDAHAEPSGADEDLEEVFGEVEEEVEEVSSLVDESDIPAEEKLATVTGTVEPVEPAVETPEYDSSAIDEGDARSEEKEYMIPAVEAEGPEELEASAEGPEESEMRDAGLTSEAQEVELGEDEFKPLETPVEEVTSVTETGEMVTSESETGTPLEPAEACSVEEIIEEELPEAEAPYVEAAAAREREGSALAGTIGDAFGMTGGTTDRETVSGGGAIRGEQVEQPKRVPIDEGPGGYDLTEPCIKVSAEYVLRQVPENMLATSIGNIETKLSTPGKIEVPHSVVLPQLGEGIVEIPFSKLLPQFPPLSFIPPVERIFEKLPGGRVELPLGEVISQLPLEALVEDKEPEADEMDEPFEGYFQVPTAAKKQTAQDKTGLAATMDEAFNKESETTQKPVEAGNIEETREEAPAEAHAEESRPTKPVERDKAETEEIEAEKPSERKKPELPITEDIPETGGFKLAKDSGPLPDEFKLTLSSLDIPPESLAGETPEEETAHDEEPQVVEEKTEEETDKGVYERLYEAEEETQAPPEKTGKPEEKVRASADESPFAGLDIDERKEKESSSVEFVEYEPGKHEAAGEPAEKEQEADDLGLSPADVELLESLLEKNREASQPEEEESLAAMFGTTAKPEEPKAEERKPETSEELEEPVVEKPAAGEKADDELEELVSAPSGESIQKELEALPEIAPDGEVRSLELRKEGRKILADVTSKLERLKLVRGEAFRSDSLDMVVLTDDETAGEEVARNVTGTIKTLGWFMERYGLGELRKAVVIGKAGTVAAVNTGSFEEGRFVVAAEKDAGMAGQLSVFISKRAAVFQEIFKASGQKGRLMLAEENSGPRHEAEESVGDYWEELMQLLGDVGIDQCMKLRYPDGGEVVLCYPGEFPEQLVTEGEPLFALSTIASMTGGLGLGSLKSMILVSDSYVLTYSAVAEAGLSGVICVFPGSCREGLAKLKSEKAAGLISAGAA